MEFSRKKFRDYLDRKGLRLEYELVYIYEKLFRFENKIILADEWIFSTVEIQLESLQNDANNKDNMLKIEKHLVEEGDVFNKSNSFANISEYFQDLSILEMDIMEGSST